MTCTPSPILSGIVAALGLFAFSSSESAAQKQLPENLVPAKTVDRFEVGSFLESIATKRDGTLLFVDHDSHNVFSMSPAGERTVFAHADLELRGIALDLDDTVYVTGKQKNGVEALFRISATGEVSPWVEAPEGRFLNGLTLLQPGVFLAADSFAEVVWRIDVEKQEITPWFRHEWSRMNPDTPRIPGPNGVKLYDGAVYMSNSALAKLIRIPILPDGSAGAPEAVIGDLVLDDFAFAADGTFYGTTHIFNTVVRIEPGGAPVIIAGPQQGVTGSTAVAFGATPSDAETLYVVGDGGVFLPPEGGLVAAELVALDVGEPGLSPVAALSWVPRPETIARVPTFLVECHTAQGTDHLRALFGPDYLRYLELNADRILFAGQLFDAPTIADQSSPDGRLYFVTTDTAQAAKQYIEASPYFTAGLYAACDVKSFNAVIGTLLGGVSWPESATQAQP